MTSRPGAVGVWSNPLRYHSDRAEAADAAAGLEDLGYGALWLADVGGDVLGDVGGILDATRDVAVATGILNIWMHPAPVPSARRLLAALGPKTPALSAERSAGAHPCFVTATGRGVLADHLALPAYVDNLRRQGMVDAGADHVCIQVVGLGRGILARERRRRPAPALVG